MPRHTVLLAIGVLAAAASAPAAWAGETACWFENGAVVVPAEIGGVAGDWLLDPSAPVTLLHETRAEMEGLPKSFTAGGKLAGAALAPVAVSVADLDGRAPGFITPITGVIGADVLGRYVVDLTFAPCRVRLTTSAPRRFGRGTRLPLTMIGGVPAVRAAIADDRSARAGLFAVDWSSTATVRAARATLNPPVTTLTPTPRRMAPARLRALSVAGELQEEPTAGVADDLDPALAGTLGVGFWSRWTVRLDIRRGEILLKPK